MRRIYFVLIFLFALLSACNQNKQKEASAGEQGQAATSAAATNKDQCVGMEWTPEPVSICIALKENVLVLY